MRNISKIMVLCVGLIGFNISYADGGLLFLEKNKAANTIVKEKISAKDKEANTDIKGKN